MLLRVSRIPRDSASSNISPSIAAGTRVSRALVLINSYPLLKSRLRETRRNTAIAMSPFASELKSFMSFRKYIPVKSRTAIAVSMLLILRLCQMWISRKPAINPSDRDMLPPRSKPNKTRTITAMPVCSHDIELLSAAGGTTCSPSL
ncbi:MAG: hypothetical protein ACD_39C00777G0001 [uncultured bacterium]|nr:MAG: hypothetical protein ACD_39C00777G0001 [uncultured bacterium]